MPVTKSAQKKLRQDRKRTSENKKLKNLFGYTVKKAIKAPTNKSIQQAIKSVDKAAKKNIIHKNKAARIKSKLSKLIQKKVVKKTKPSLRKKASRSL